VRQQTGVMKDPAGRQAAAISGVTVLALHHHDGIGLLAQAHFGANGYRYDGRAELFRLRRHLFHRDPGEIAALMDAMKAHVAREASA
jgi:DNA-binding transcriptional MerR regulator